MKTCTCGTCSWCEAKRQHLAIGARTNWEARQISPCAWIAKGERFWRIFGDTHPESELRAAHSWQPPTPQDAGNA